MGKVISIYYNDTPGTVQRVDGVVLAKDANWLTIRKREKNGAFKRVGIPRERIIRTEEMIEERKEESNPQA